MKTKIKLISTATILSLLLVGCGEVSDPTVLGSQTESNTTQTVQNDSSNEESDTPKQPKRKITETTDEKPVVQKQTTNPEKETTTPDNSSSSETTYISHSETKEVFPKPNTMILNITEDKETEDDSKSTETTTEDNELIQNCNSISQAELIGANYSLNDSVDLSQKLLKNSADILNLSNSILESNHLTNDLYIRAMLALSEDILVMAQNINSMGDKILLMSDDIDEISQNILKTQEIQGENLKVTQANILQAQKNFNTALR